MKIKYNTIIITVICVMLSLMIFMRGMSGIDPDYQAYKYIYDMVSRGYEEQLRVKDHLYLYLNRIGVLLGIEFIFFLWLLGFISILGKAFVVNTLNKKVSFIFIIIYGFSAFIIFEMIQIRVGLALLFYYVFLLSIRKKVACQGIVFLITAFIAINLHLSSSLLFLASLIYLRINRISYIPAVIILLTSYTDLFTSIYDFSKLSNNQTIIDYSYQLLIISGIDMSSLLNPSVILSLVFVIFSAYFVSCVDMDDFNRKIVILNTNLMIASIALFCLLSISPVISYRISELFRVLLPLSSAILFCVSFRIRYGVFFQGFILLFNLLFSYMYLKALIYEDLF